MSMYIFRLCFSFYFFFNLGSPFQFHFPPRPREGPKAVVYSLLHNLAEILQWNFYLYFSCIILNNFQIKRGGGENFNYTY